MSGALPPHETRVLDLPEWQALLRPATVAGAAVAIVAYRVPSRLPADRGWTDRRTFAWLFPRLVLTLDRQVADALARETPTSPTQEAAA